MDLLTKFASIEIKPDARISEADRLFCQTHQAAYDTAREALQELEFFWEDIQCQQQEVLAPVGMPSETYLSTYGKLDLSVNDIREQRRSLHPVFIHNLAAYFSDAYHLSIKAGDIKENLLPHKPSYSFPQDCRQQTEEYTSALDSLSLHYTEILEQIFLQTGGQELAEAAVHELKERCRRAAWGSGSNKAAFTLKKSTLQIERACRCRDYCRALATWELYPRAMDILKGIAHFEAEGFSDIPGSLGQLLQKGTSNDGTLEFSGCSKVHSMKLYKNWRMDIKFHAEGHARKFVEDYLGTVPPC